MKENLKTIIEVDVSTKTAEMLEKIKEESGLSAGDLIDKLVLNLEAYTAEATAQLILDDLLAYTQNLTQKQIEKTLFIVISVIEKSLSDDISSELNVLVHKTKELLCSR